jgi:hypothetical protein
MRFERILAALVLAAGLIPAAAGAVTTATVIATDGQQAVPRSSVQLFDTTTGTEVKQEDKDNNGAAVFLLPKGSYRVVVDGKAVQEITVTGEGEQTVTVSVGGGAAAMTGSVAHGGPEIYVGVEGSYLWFLGDDFVPGSGTDADDLAKPDTGYGGRLFGAVEFDERWLARGALSGAWLSGDLHEGFDTFLGPLTSEEESRIDARWANLDFYRLWTGRSGLVGLGGGLEYADIRHRFDSQALMSGAPFVRVRQQTESWGIGPRVSGMFEHELFGDVRGFAEGGLAYLFGDRDGELRADVFGSEFEENASDGDHFLHFSGRVGVRREFDYDGMNFSLYGGWQFDQFTDTTNLEFLPSDTPGDVRFHGPFIGIGVRWGG